MTYRIDVTQRNGRAFIERMFNSRPFHKNDGQALAVYGVALSGGKALERNVNQNEKWLALVDDRLLSVAYQTRANYGAWQDGVSEGGFLCLVDKETNGRAFEVSYSELAKDPDMGDASEEAILRVTYHGANIYFADLVFAFGEPQALKTWRAGE
jgi:hypothetical protein